MLGVLLAEMFAGTRGMGFLMQRMAMAFLCLAMAQVVLASCEPDLSVPAAARMIGE